MTESIQNDQNNKSKEFLLVVDRVMDTVDMCLAQFTSGRWLLTVIVGVILLRSVWVNPEHMEKIIDICKDVVIFYFVLRPTTPNKESSNVQSDSKLVQKDIQQPTSTGI